LQPVVPPDPSDLKLAHLDRLNLSRAWMLEGIAAGLPKNDKRLAAIRATAEEHKRAGLAAVTGEQAFQAILDEVDQLHNVSTRLERLAAFQGENG
jgi:hypothetical protein